MPAGDLLSSADSAHLLRRSGYGGTATEVASLAGMTRTDAVDAVMGHRETDTTPVGPTPAPPTGIGNPSQWEAHGAVIDWWVGRMATMTNPAVAPSPVPAVAADLPIYDRLAFFWHNHFACAQDKVSDIDAMWDQLSLFRRAGMGSFASLLRSVSVHPAMLVHLDNQHNTVWDPQENFGRELMELYTCGVGNFTESDVVAMTAAWTGHNTVGWNSVLQFWNNAYVYDPARHDHGSKTLFGITANWNGVAQDASERDVIDELVTGVRQSATASRIARLMFRYFANLEPSPATVDQLAQSFVAGGMEISSLVRAILLHDDFWAPESRWAQVKNPLDYVVSIVRETGVPAADLNLRWRMHLMGMVPLDPPSVAGWEVGSAWLSTASAWGRGQFAGSMRWGGSGSGAAYGLLAGAADLGRDAAINAIFDVFGLDEVSAPTRNRLLAWFDEAHANHRWSIEPQGFMLGALVPEFQVY